MQLVQSLVMAALIGGKWQRHLQWQWQAGWCSSRPIAAH